MGRELKRVPLGFPKEPNARHLRNPPKGPGYQMWQTVSDAPYTPTFATAEELASYCAANPWGADRDHPPSYAQWLTFINGPGWAPSMVVVGGQMLSGVGCMPDEPPAEIELWL